MRTLILLTCLFFSMQNNCVGVLYDSYSIDKNYELKTTPNYVVFGKEYENSAIKNVANDDLLELLKEKIHHRSSALGKYPNTCKGNITFFYDVGGKKYHQKFEVKNNFVSGGHFFTKKDLGFKQENRFLTAYDLVEAYLGPDESEGISDIPGKERGLVLGHCLEDLIRKEISGGAWRDNCSHSEALFFLQFKQNLKVFFKALKHKITITGCVINISSNYDPCFGCLKLSQGFQWNLKHFIEELNNPNLEIADDFGTLCLIYGQKESAHPIDYENYEYSRKVRTKNEPAILEPGQHKFVQVVSY